MGILTILSRFQTINLPTSAKFKMQLKKRNKTILGLLYICKMINNDRFQILRCEYLGSNVSGPGSHTRQDSSPLERHLALAPNSQVDPSPFCKHFFTGFTGQNGKPCIRKSHKATTSPTPTLLFLTEGFSYLFVKVKVLLLLTDTLLHKTKRGCGDFLQMGPVHHQQTN